MNKNPDPLSAEILVMGLPSKIQEFPTRVVIGNSQDRISHLPDGILCHILSFLPTKYAVGTSVLSTRWKYLWTFIPNLEFDDTLLFTAEESKRHPVATCFMNFVDKVLDLHDVSYITNFSLKCSEDYDLSRVDAWISTVMKKNVQELDLYFFMNYPIALPRCLFTSESLKVLKLTYEITFDIPTDAHFPNLRVVHLTSVLFQDGNSTQRLISGCPVLEVLVIDKSGIDGIEVFNVCSPTLKRFTLSCCLDNLEDDCECTFLVEASALEYFELTDIVQNHYTLTNLCSLINAKIDVLFCRERAFEILQGIFMVKYLSLSYFMVEALYESNKDFPIFRNLIYMDLANEDYVGQLSQLSQPPETACNQDAINKLLESSPALEVLILNAEHVRLSNWSPPQSVPGCLVLHLEALEIRGFKEQEEVMLLANYFLENAKVLKKMTIVSVGLDVEQELNISKKVLSLPRGSDNCQISISNKALS
ncbi:unnamed protein product [Ilex paraguariensis]|uniref:FBD domain-containing protein n=1 Tax=Ilex paraguariensis TaxID=185542 RepID=A0ABC8TH99_9AQUA